MDHEEIEEYEIHDQDMNDEDEVENQEVVPENEKKAYIPGISRPLEDGEELEFDPKAYKLFHSFETNWPCLSFDVVSDGLGDQRTEMPYEMYMVSATQADKAKDNEILVMGLKNLTALNKEGEESDEDDDDESDDEEGSEKKDEPKMHAISIPCHGGANRIRTDRIGDSTVAAVWNDTGKVQLWNVTSALNSSNAMTGASQTVKINTEKPLFSFAGQGREGFAVAWNPLKKGKLATGDVVRNIFIWNMHEGGTWAVDQRPLTGHKKAVEDIVWSPTEESLMATCSSDKTIKMWDTRASPKDACVCTVEQAHESDVNVISWNKHDALLVSGGDDGELKIWSLKTIQFGQPVARFKHHSAPITSVEWHPQDTTTFMASGEDDQTSIWDIATENDDGEAIEGIPPQLMFLHLGQKEVKEVHWHPQIPGLAINTAMDGFNVFKTINI